MPNTFCISFGFDKTLLPLNSIVPLSGLIKVDIIDIIVDLPAPLGPNKPIISPFATFIFTPLTASISP